MRAAARANEPAPAPVQHGANIDAAPVALYLSSAERMVRLRAMVELVGGDLSERSVMSLEALAAMPAGEDRDREETRRELRLAYELRLADLSEEEREEIRRTCLPWKDLPAALVRALVKLGARARAGEEFTFVPLFSLFVGGDR